MPPLVKDSTQMGAAGHRRRLSPVEITRQARSRIGSPHVCLVWRFPGEREYCHRQLRHGHRGSLSRRVRVRSMGSRKHNRLSVQPLLGLATRFRVGDTAGLLLSNFGLGPAKVTNTELTLDDDRIGDFSKPYRRQAPKPSIRPAARNHFGRTPFSRHGL